MLTLRGRANAVLPSETLAERQIFRVSDDPARPLALRRSEGFIVRDAGRAIPSGFAWYLYLALDETDVGRKQPSGAGAVFLPETFNYLGDGDVVRLSPRGDFGVLFRRNSQHNHFLLTERCNNYCLMCSQPPRDIDDSPLVADIAEVLPLIDLGTRSLGFTGGEPTLLGEQLFRLIRLCKSYLPNTGLHILSNGRRFADAGYAEAYAAEAHPDLMIGIPVYSDLADIHDYVVQAKGAFDETIRGILNLKAAGQRVEIRVVIHKQTYERLPDLARFISRNLLFVDQVALMGLEMTGFTRANLDALWIDPAAYQEQLAEAVQLLAASGVRAMVYNHQLCLLDERVRPFSVRSISDWKNEYMPECDGCLRKDECGGFFASAKLRYSDNIRPFPG